MNEYEAYDLAIKIVNKMNNPTVPTGKQILTADNEYLCEQLELIIQPIIQAYKILKKRIDMDKVQKIREGVVGLLNNHDSALDYEAAIEDVLSIIDSSQEEPVSNDFEEAMQHNAPDNIGVDDLLYWRNGFITGAKWKKEIVNEDFEEVVKKLWNEINSGHEYSVIESYNVFYGLCLDIASWQKEQMTAKATEVDLEKEYKDFIKCDNGRSMFETAKYFFELGLKARKENKI